MSAFMTLTRLSAEDARTTTVEIRRCVREAVERHGAAGVGAPVAEAVVELEDAAATLARYALSSFPERRATDRGSDRCVAAAHHMLCFVEHAFADQVVELTEGQQQRLEAARRVRQQVFPDGTSFLKARWSEQYGATDMLVQRANEPPLRADIELLGLGEHFDLIATIHAAYGQRMGFSDTPPDDAEPLVDWHVALERYLAVVLAFHRHGSALREELLAPYEAAAARSRAGRRSASASGNGSE